MADGHEAEADLLGAASDIAMHQGCTKLVVCTGYRALSEPVEEWQHEVRNTMIADIHAGEETAWMALRPNVRNNIRKGQKAGLTLEWGAEHLPNFHRVYADLMARKGLPGLPRKFFTNILSQLGDRAAFLAALVDGRVLGGTVVLRTGTIHHCTFQAADPNASSAFAPTPAMEWEVIRTAIAAGAAKADLGESTPDSGTFKFKRRYGGEATELHYYHYKDPTRPESSPNQKSQAAPTSPSPSLQHRVYDAAPLWGQRWVSQRRGMKGRVI
ncbi:MAG: GNAT family N-acetyltransferase [Alphaproteobacteria bacterium]|nr:GNAT family N-acetyltransferase [Alphaproteobacteria bacterium]